MRRIHGVNDEINQMTKIIYLQTKDYVQMLICMTRPEHNGIVMQNVCEEGSKNRMSNHIKRLMRKQERNDTSI